MVALSCVILIICVLMLMIKLGVGPFANEPWAALHVKFSNLSSPAKFVLTLLSVMGAIVCSAVIIGLIS